MLYLILAIASSTLVSLAMRISEKHIKNQISMLAVNYVACMLLAGLYTGFQNLFAVDKGMAVAVGLGVIGGFLYLGSFMLLQWNISKNGVVLPTTFMKLGVLVPAVLSITFFGEIPKLTQLCGLAAAIAAILLIHFEKGRTKAEHKGGLIALLLVGGGTDAMSKIYEQFGERSYEDQFLLFIFIVALLLCTGLALYKKQRLGRAEVLFGLLIGIPNYYSARFLLLALSDIPAVVAYPTYSVGTIVVIILAGFLLFHEKLSHKQKAAMAMIFVSLVLLNS